MLLRFRAALLCGTALVIPAPLAAQSPVLDRVVAGGITIRQDPATTQVQQSQSRGIVDWRSFNVGSGHHVQFQQPSASAITLNRVTTPDPSTIAGRITANGRIAIVNQSGVVFSQGAQVEAAGLIVSSADIGNENFLAGRMIFDRAGRPDARIENAGTITIRDAGLAALVAPQVANRGTITARLGRVALAGGETHVVDLHGDGLLSIEVTGAVRQAPGGGVALVTNSGVISAEGGAIQITAAAADGIVQDLVRAGGRISADTDAATGRTGRIAIQGTGGAIRIEGEVTAAGRAAGTRGGTIEAVADRVLVDAGARIDASGAAGGGEVAIGTTVRGSATPRLARRTGIAAGAEIRADATERGAGGTVIVNSQDYTAHGGRISARGGPQGGDGGFVEVSGQGGLLVLGSIDTGAPAGAPGTILIDPIDLTIIGPTEPPPPGTTEANIVGNVLGADDPPDQAFLRSSTIEFLTGDVRLEASRDIFVNAPVAGDTVGGALTLDAGRNLEVNDRISGFQGLTLIARTGDVLVQGNGGLFDATGIAISAGNAIALGGTGTSTDGLLDLQAGAGGISQTEFLRAALLQVRTPGTANFDFAGTGPTPGPNRIGALGASNVGGDLFLRTDIFDLQAADQRLQVTGEVTVGGRLTLAPTPGVTQQAPSRIAAAELVVETPGTVELLGDNAIQAVAGIDAGDSIVLRNLASLTVTGPVTASGGGSNAAISVQVEGGDLTIAAPVLATTNEGFGLVSLAASGNLAVTAAGSVTAEGPSGGIIGLLAAAAFSGGSASLDPALPGGISLAGNVTAVDGFVGLQAGQGGIVQSGGGITTGGLQVISGGAALLGSAANGVDLLVDLDVAGTFLLDNGITDLRVQTGPSFESQGRAGAIGIRTAGAVTMEDGAELVATDRVSFRVGSLNLANGAIAAPLVEIAPFAPAAVTLPVLQPLGAGFEITSADLAAVTSQAVRIGATTLDGTLATTANGITIVAPLAVPGTLDLRSLAGIAQDPGADLAVGTLAGAAGGSVTLTNPGNSLGTLAGFAAGGDFRLVATTPLLNVPGGTTVSAGGTLFLQVLGGGLQVDGTATGAATTLLADGGVAVNGFSAIATADDLLLSGATVTVNGLVAAAGDIIVLARSAASLAGEARTSNVLFVSAPSIAFGGLNARGAAVELALGPDGTAGGTLDARGLTVFGGRGATLFGTLAGVPGRPAAALGRRATVQGVLLPDPPPQATDFTFNDCPIGVAACAVPTTPLPLPNNPEAVTGVLDPLNLLAAVERLRQPDPELSLRPGRDRSEENELAPPDIRGGDY
jgi:filamentous hemagglutinin family protein